MLSLELTAACVLLLDIQEKANQSFALGMYALTSNSLA